MEIIIAIASKIGESLVTPIGTEFGYLINYHSNLENLKGEIKKLIDKKDGVQGLVDAAQRNGESIKPDVRSWLKDVNDRIQKVSRFEDEINKKRRCMYRWRLSRKAYKIKQDVLQLQKEGRNVAPPTPPPEIWSKFEKGFKDFKSRMAKMNEVIEGLKREEVRMMGICGMGGVGKTTMVKEIITRLTKLNLFEKIVMATVSRNPSIRTIQSEIAEEIGLELKEETESGRARRLHGRLMDIKRILIVLDDVWTELDCAAIGLPYGDTHKGCKILLTSRDSDVCNRMGSQPIIAVPTLTTEESWELFREMVGESFNDPDLRSIAKDVVKECGGLPIAIVTVGKALEKKKKHEWDDALNQLRNSRPKNIPGVNNKVYSCIKWSYDGLESDETRSCLLLCCLFPEDYDISIEYVVRYGWGRGYFSSIITLEDARNRVHSLVDQLKRRFLLLEGDSSETMKMHDVVRDVAISIASRDPYQFLVRCHAENKGWPNLATYDDYTTISLVGKLEIPVGLKCPKLELLQTMEGRFSEGSMGNICNAMTELKVLALVEMKSLGSLRSLGVLKNLWTLCLDGSKFDGMSTNVIGSLDNLEILSFRGCRSMRELPREIGRLKQLRLLDTTYCWTLEVIPHGIFSSLCRLEELYMLNSFTKWEIGRGREDKGMASISEVMSLSDHLKVLAIQIPSVIHLKDMVLKSPTIKFAIGCVAPYIEEMTTYAFENCLEIDESDAKELESRAIRLLLKKSKKLLLRKVKNFSVLIDLDQEGFQDLKDLYLFRCPNIEYLANGTSGTQQALFPRIQSVSQLPDSFLSNLRYLDLKYCGVLKYAFSLSAARNLVQLQKLSIVGCDQMEEIVSKQGGEHEEEIEEEETKYMILFPKLNTLVLVDLPRLTSLCPEGSTFPWSSPKYIHVEKCEKLKTLGAVIPQRKKLENKSEKDSTSHDFSTSPTRSSNWCPAGGKLLN
ncbi:hypothetical protein C1H46_013429 [Malus baccata]|uniref:Uncharacterized protein n=1 Tax=Malus baccata TaxID=106549 RepID=A0A540MQ20_MALBA|nr:hypothetical protein C1H46_013429 [Malus baccata]